MANPPVHRSTPTSKAGRRMINIGKEPLGNLTKEQQEWNARVKSVKRAKREAKMAAKGHVYK